MTKKKAPTEIVRESATKPATRINLAVTKYEIGVILDGITALVSDGQTSETDFIGISEFGEYVLDCLERQAPDHYAIVMAALEKRSKESEEGSAPTRQIKPSEAN